MAALTSGQTAALGIETTIHVLAVILTVLRLAIRVHNRRFWYEDACASLALVSACITVVTLWLISLPLDCTDDCPESNRHSVAAWLMIVAYTFTVWVSRCSILLSILRVATDRHVYLVTSLAFGLFVGMSVIGVSVKISVCATDIKWETVYPALCPLGVRIAATEIVTDIIGDVILVFLPLRMLWRTKLAASFRTLLLTVFAMSALSTLTSIVHVVFILRPLSFLSGLTANLHASVTLIVCNLLVITTFFYRIFHEADIERTMAITSTTPRGVPTSFTTVDLESLHSISHGVEPLSDMDSGAEYNVSRGFRGFS